MRRAPHRISVDIERLVLDGVTLGPGGAERVRAAATAAIAERIAAAGLDPAFAAGGRHRELRGLSMAQPGGDLTRPSVAAAFGGRIGAAVADGLGGRGPVR